MILIDSFSPLRIAIFDSARSPATVNYFLIVGTICCDKYIKRKKRGESNDFEGVSENVTTFFRNLPIVVTHYTQKIQFYTIKEVIT